MSHERTIMSLSRPTFTLVLAGAAAAAVLGALVVCRCSATISPPTPRRPRRREPSLAPLASLALPRRVRLHRRRVAVGTCRRRRTPLPAAGRRAARRRLHGQRVHPAKIGDAVKIALCARAIDAPDRLWTATGDVHGARRGAVADARRLLVVAAARRTRCRSGRSSPSSAPPALVAAVAVAPRPGFGTTRGSPASSPAWRPLANDSPRARVGARAWTIVMQLLRLAGRSPSLYAFGLPHPLLAALVIIPALDLAGDVPDHARRASASAAAPSRWRSRAAGSGDSGARRPGSPSRRVETLVSVAFGALGTLRLAGRQPAVTPLDAAAGARRSVGGRRRARRRLLTCWRDAARRRAGTTASRAPRRWPEPREKPRRPSAPPSPVATTVIQSWPRAARRSSRRR